MQEKDETLTSKLSMGKVKISQPLISTTVPDGVCGQLSYRFGTPSPSESLGCELEQPLESTASPTGVSATGSLGTLGQASIYEFRIFEDTRIGNDYKMLSSSDQLELHNKILFNLKDVKFQSNLIKSIDDWNSFVSTSQSIFNLTDLHIKSHDYAISLKNEIEATDLYINNIDENIKNKLILIDLYEEYYVEWDISTSAQQRASVDEKYITLINAQITKLDQSIGVLNQYNLEMNKTREVNALAYENLDLDKCNNEE